MSTNIIQKLSEVGLHDIERVGGKNASLGEMIGNLTKLGINIPDGFVINVDGYYTFIQENKLDEAIRETVAQIDFASVESLRRGGLKIRQMIRNAKFPQHLSLQIISAYKILSEQYGQDFTDVAVRSSATAEDLPDASFAGQQETYLNVRGPASLIDSVRNCFASLFTDRAISYRNSFKYDHFLVGLSVGVQKMVRSDLASSGVAFSIDTESGFKNTVLINGSYGLGEMIVQGSISPDEFLVFKPTLQLGFASIIEKKLGTKDKKMIYGDNPDERVQIIPCERNQQQKFCINNETVLKVAKWVCTIEDYYSNLKNKWCPVDVEWAIDGLTNELFIVQARPETIHSRKDLNNFHEYIIDDEKRSNRIILQGIAVGDKIASGKVNILFSLDKRITEGHEFTEGDILVTDMTDPDWEPIMKKAAAIVTNKGGRTCHAAIVARELGVPAIVGCHNATEFLAEGKEITVSCAEGDVGYVYEGSIAFKETTTDLASIAKVKTAMMLNVANPNIAFNFAGLPHKGVGLAREEFIINNYIKVHPLALLQHKKLKDPQLTKEIEKLATGFENEVDFFVSKLAYGIGKIGAAFYPETVIVRFSDFKSNEYFNLLGGKYFEPNEENPMIGWRGASRYYSEKYKDAFALECKAILKARKEFGLKNIAVMIPFCRTVGELHKVTDVMKKNNLVRGKDGLKLFLMAEVPSNILLADEFAKYIDGFSIGSNDLTQLTLGLDRDSSLVAHLYDERNEAVKMMIRMLIEKAKNAGVKVGICGQGPSDFPDFAQFLVEENIDSISVTPDSFIKTTRAIAEIENEKIKEENIVLEYA